MNALLVRVGADQSTGGGRWNGPVDAQTGRFVYVPIPETKPNRPGLAKPYSLLVPALRQSGAKLPDHLVNQRMHLDPDFEHLTYGDRGSKGRQIASTLGAGDLVVFYAGLADQASRKLVYALIGLLVVDRIDRAVEWAASSADRNAHTRRELPTNADDIIVVGRGGVSGRLARCIPIGEYRDRAYRVRKDLLAAWGDISANDGYLQRSAIFPSLLDPHRFWEWWQQQRPELVRENNLR